MDGKSRYRAYQRTNGYKRRYYAQLNNENPSDLYSHQLKSMAYSHVPTQISVEPLMANKALSSLTPLPQERQSWIHSVRNTETNGDAKQRTKYLEAMHCMQSFIRSVNSTTTNESIEPELQYLQTSVLSPEQQKSSTDSVIFDPVRFANQRMPMSADTMENPNKTSFHLINNTDNHEEISTLERILLNHEQQSHVKSSAKRMINGQSTEFTKSNSTPFSAFLIDDCEEAEPSSAIEEFIEKHQEDLDRRRPMLIQEFESAHAQRKQQSKRPKLLQKNESSASKPSQQSNQQESSADWIIEYDTTEPDQLSQLTSTIKDVAITMTDDEKIAGINMIVKNIEKERLELTKLRQRVMSMLDDASQSNIEQQRSSANQELLKILNQTIISGCWLCSGKTYTEVATQCNNLNE